MKRYSCALSLVVCLGLCAGAAIAQNAPNADLRGAVTDDSGTPVAAANVTLRGPSAYRTVTDSHGAYAFTAVVAGTYELAVTKGGFAGASQPNVTIAAGQSVRLDVVLRAASFSSLRTIGTVRASATRNFNTSPAAIDVIPASTFAAQGFPQVTAVLNQVPGVQISFPGSSANGAAPGAITFPNIRNGLSYETASLIDGHPLSVGLYGDYVTTFLNSALLQDAEIVKGPGATAPAVNYAINGTVNFRTKDPTAGVEPFYSAGGTNFGGVLFDFGVSDTVGRVGFVAGIAGYNEVSALNNAPILFDPGSGSGDINGVNTYPYGCGGLNGSFSPTPLLGTSAKTFFSRAYNGCTAVGSASVSGRYDSLSQLLKLRYKLSDRTYFTASYFGSQTTANQSGNTANIIPSIFQPGPGYAGPLKAGAQVNVLSAAYDAQPQFETNNEPIFQLELGTGFSNDTLLARFYHATISRIQNAGFSDPFFAYLQSSNIYGSLSAFPNPFNGASVFINQYNFFNSPEIDKLTGYSLQYTHPFTPDNELTVSGDYTDSNSVAYYNDLSFGGSQCQIGTVPHGYCFNTSTSLPQGAAQAFTTILLRDREQFTPKLAGTFALYANYYHSSYPTDCANIFDSSTDNQTTCLPTGYLETFNTKQGSAFVSSVPVNFDTTTHNHMDPRIGLEWRPRSNLAVRAAAGSSIAPPFLYVLSQANGAISAPSHSGPGAVATQTINSGNLRPETAFGYNLGADYAFKDGATYLTADAYLTNLFGQFLNVSYPNGLCPVSAGCKPNTPLFVSQYVNLSNARYEGIELGIRRVPAAGGFGFLVQGSTQRGFPYNLPSDFYCAFKPTAKLPCVPANYNANLNILPGQNYYGEYIDNTGSTTSGVSNQSLPYLQGNAEISYRLRNGAFALFGDTLYGKNNSLNRPPFGVAYASINYPVSKDLAIQVSGSNIFNAYSGLFPVYGGGVTVPLANGLSAGTIGNVLGPARYLFILTTAPAPSRL